MADMLQPQIIRAAVDCALGGKEGNFPTFVMDAVNSKSVICIPMWWTLPFASRMLHKLSLIIHL